jgi:hypothetical protein
MQVRTFTVLFLLMAIFLIITVAAEVFVDDYVKPQSLFAYLVLGSLITGFASLAINIEVPD